MKGAFVDQHRLPSQIEHLYGLTVFENYLYATNSDNANTQQKTSVIRVNRFNSTEYQVVTRVDKGGALHIYHQRRQPRGKRSPPKHPQSWLHPNSAVSSGLLQILPPAPTYQPWLLLAIDILASPRPKFPYA